MRESAIERKLVNHIRQQGGKCWKWESPGTAGVPDRICLLPGGRVVFVEVKAPGEKPRPLQVKRHEELKVLGFDVRVIDSEEAIHEI
ncbi:nuclease [Paenibacillus sp. J31TS4]|uniref:VRR-NUC domain-containing protein n=1 Tax=Paenibacillus sp. J31TS4 TaxID=2807195 RepID=UPI001B11142C|nr:VRR-NUC domain-containing protein [Paenibacillus sp. J31TS4]GIP38321.1 nuclease [Paenibacillus sp. J31TS4]